MDPQDEFVKEFLAESREGLDQLDSDLIALEEAPRDHKLVDSIFRTLHTIKGNSGFLNFDGVGQLAHAGENLLQRLRSGEQSLSSDITDALLRLMDVLRSLLDEIQESGSDDAQRFQDVRDRLIALAEPQKVGDGDSATVVTDPGALAAPADTCDATILGLPTDLAEASSPTEPPSGNAAPPIRPIEKTSAGVPIAPITPPESGQSISEDATPHQTPEQNSTQSRPESVGTITTDPDRKPPEPRGEQQSESATSTQSSLIRVDVDLLDRLMNLVGELVLARNQILELYSRSSDSNLLNPIQRLNALTSELQDGVLKTRMQQIGSIWQRYPRMVRDFARSSGKQVALELYGHETELDKSLVESIADPLTHLIRNAVDHGIESPQERQASGKPPQGLITLRASHESGRVNIEITDDGRGLDAEKIRSKAVSLGLFEEASVLDQDSSKVLESIFIPGFSTADKISKISGRGVGMDVVKTRIESVGGTIEIDSEATVGTSFRLTVPLTLAIIPALIVACQKQRFAIPQTNVVELLQVRENTDYRVEFFHDCPVLRLRGDILPIINLSAELRLESESAPVVSQPSVVVLKTGSRQFAMIVDEIGNSEEIVVKPFGRVLDGMSEYGGATIMGDGSVALILDIRGVAASAGLLSADHSLTQSASRSSLVSSDKESGTVMLLAELANGRQVAFRLAEVVHLEQIPIGQLEIANGRDVVQYRGEILPLIFPVRLLDAAFADAGADASESSDGLNVIVCGSSTRQLGVVVRRVVDIVEIREELEMKTHGETILGTTVALGKVTDVFDTAQLINQLERPEIMRSDQKIET